MNEQTSTRLRFVINTAYFATILLLVYLAFHYVLGWVLPFILAIAIVSVVHPIIRTIKKWLHVEGAMVSLLIMLLVYVLFCSLAGLLIVRLSVWIFSLIVQLPTWYDSTLRPAMETAGNALLGFVQGLPAEWQHQLVSLQDEVLKMIQSLLLALSQRAVSAASRFTTRIPSVAFTMLFTILLSFFISMQYPRVLGFLRRLLPAKAEENLDNLKAIFRRTVVQYLRATGTMMMVTAAELSVGLLFLRRPYAILIAVAITIFDALPVLGTGTILVPWAVIELLQGNISLGAGLAILYGIVALVRNILEPKIISDKLGLNPIASLIAIYLGFRTLGVLGMIFMPILFQILIALYQAGTFPFLRDLFPGLDHPDPPVSP